MKRQPSSVIAEAARISGYLCIFLTAAFDLEIGASLVQGTFPVITMWTAPAVSGIILLFAVDKDLLVLIPRLCPEEKHNQVLMVLFLLLLAQPLLSIFILPLYASLNFLFQCLSGRSFLLFFALVFAVYLLYRILKDQKSLKNH